MWPDLVTGPPLTRTQWLSVKQLQCGMLTLQSSVSLWIEGHHLHDQWSAMTQSMWRHPSQTCINQCVILLAYHVESFSRSTLRYWISLYPGRQGESTLAYKCYRCFYLTDLQDSVTKPYMRTYLSPTKGTRRTLLSITLKIQLYTRIRRTIVCGFLYPLNIVHCYMLSNAMHVIWGTLFGDRV